MPRARIDNGTLHPTQDFPLDTIVQAGSHEVLLDDALRLARQAAVADVEVTLDITPGVPHVFQAFAALLDEGQTALTRAGAFLREQMAAAAALTSGQ